MANAATETPESLPNPRDAAMAAIAANARSQRDQALEEEGLLPVADPADPVEPKPEIIDNGADDTNNLIDTRDGKQFLALNVNGEQKEVSVEDAVAELQKGRNLDYQTQLVVEERNRLRVELEALRSGSTQPDDTNTDSAKTHEEVEHALQALYDDGDVKGAAQVIADIASKPQQAAGMDAGQVTELLRQHDDKRRLGDAFKAFKATDRFKSITSDPDLMEMLDSKTEALTFDTEYMATKPTYSDIFEKAGDQVLAKFGQPQTGTTDDVVERKRSQPAAVPTRTARRKAPEAPAPKTTSQIIAEIAKARGQTGY